MSNYSKAGSCLWAAAPVPGVLMMSFFLEICFQRTWKPVPNDTNTHTLNHPHTNTHTQSLTHSLTPSLPPSLTLSLSSLHFHHHHHHHHDHHHHHHHDHHDHHHDHGHDHGHDHDHHHHHHDVPAMFTSHRACRKNSQNVRLRSKECRTLLWSAKVW